jgi:hypothetical protein
LLYSETLQEWFRLTAPAFPGSEWAGPAFAVVVFAYGGVPFLRRADLDPLSFPETLSPRDSLATG